MNYNINFQIAALIIVILLLYHFLTQKKLYNINARTFTYVLVLGGLYILLDLLSTLVFMNYRAEHETAILLVITIAYLFDVMLPYILYCCVCIISGEKQMENQWNLSCVYCDHSGDAASDHGKYQKRLVLLL